MSSPSVRFPHRYRRYIPSLLIFQASHDNDVAENYAGCLLNLYSSNCRERDDELWKSATRESVNPKAVSLTFAGLYRQACAIAVAHRLPRAIPSSRHGIWLISFDHLILSIQNRKGVNVSIFPTKILLATDSSEEATLAAKTAADITQKTGSELHIVHARPVPVYID